MLLVATSGIFVSTSEKFSEGNQGSPVLLLATLGFFVSTSRTLGEEINRWVFSVASSNNRVFTYVRTYRVYTEDLKPAVAATTGQL